MPSAEFTALVGRFGTRPYDLLRVTFSNTLAGTTSWLFCDSTAVFAHLRLGVDVLPLLTKLGGVSVEIAPGQVQTKRGFRQVKFRDLPDYPEDFPAGAAVVSGASFFERLQVAYPQWHRAKVEYLYCADDATMDAVAKAEPMMVAQLEEWEFEGDNEVAWQLSDVYALKATQAPNPLSDGNTLTATMGTGATAVPLALPAELPDPTTWPSRDWLPQVLQIDTEKIIVSHKDPVTGLPQVAANYLNGAEDFNATDWPASAGVWTRTPASIPGPWGQVNGCLLSCASAGKILQATALPWQGNPSFFTFDLWLREHPSDPGRVVRLNLEDSLGPIGWEDRTLTPYWKRFRVSAGSGSNLPPWGPSVEVFGAATFYAAQAQAVVGQQKDRVYVFPGPSGAGTLAGRGAYGTTVASHALGATVRELYEARAESAPAEPLHPVWLAADLLNRAYVPPAWADPLALLPGFQVEADVQNSGFRRTISDPRGVKELLGEIQEQAALNLWASREGPMACRLWWRPRGTATTFPELSRADDMVQAGRGAPSFQVQSNRASAVNAVLVYWGLLLDASAKEYDGSKAEHYAHREIFLDADPSVVGADFRSLAVRSIAAKWIFRQAEASGLGGRIISRFRKGARSASAIVGFHRFLDCFVGETVRLRHLRLVDWQGTGAVAATPAFQVVGVDYGPQMSDMRVKFLEARQRRYCHITPDPFYDYTDLAVTPAWRDFYGWIGTSPGNLVGSPPEDGYYIA